MIINLMRDFVVINKDQIILEQMNGKYGKSNLRSNNNEEQIKEINKNMNKAYLS